MSLFGVLVCAFSIGLFKLASFGVDPFQSYMSGLDQLVDLDFGTLYLLMNVLLLCFSVAVDQHYIGLATFINLFLTGYIAQFSLELLQMLFPEPTFVLRVISLVIGIVLMCFSSAFYVTADLGVSTYDAVALILSNKWKVGPFRFVRIGTDLVCILLGLGLFFLGGGTWGNIGLVIGVGTVVTAFFMGPLIDLFNRKIAEPFLKGR